MATEVSIIGAGLSGLSLALALQQQSIPCVVYESRPAPLNIGGAVMLSPNSLRIMDRLGLYSFVQGAGYNFDLLDFATTTGQHIDTYEFGSASKYGYQGNRIYRHELIDITLSRLQTLNIPVKYGYKFSHIVEETSTSVTFAWADGSTHTSSLLIGADGIHSTVRKYLHPSLEPTFTGMAGITAAVPSSQVSYPPNQPRITQPLTLIAPSHGAFVLAPQKRDGSEMLLGKQRHLPPADRAGWDAIHKDKADSIAFLQQDASVFGELVVSATSHISENKINVWPFYVIPRLDRWTSTDKYRRVVILGDAAHAIPPSAGQGINQAFEDAWMFALLLGQWRKRGGEESEVEDMMRYWQEFRQERVDKVLELNKQIDARRMPRKEGDEEAKKLAEKSFEMGWLYSIEYEDVVAKYWESVGKR